MPPFLLLYLINNFTLLIFISFSFTNISVEFIWASARENLSSGVCEQHRRRPVYASGDWLETRSVMNTEDRFSRDEAHFIKASGHDQEIPESQTADQPTATRGRATEHQQSQYIRKTIKVKQPALFFSSR